MHYFMISRESSSLKDTGLSKFYLRINPLNFFLNKVKLKQIVPDLLTSQILEDNFKNSLLANRISQDVTQISPETVMTKSVETRQ